MRKALRITLWILGSIILLVLLVVLLISTPPGKRIVRQQALKFLRSKLGTEVQIGDIDYALPKMIVLKDVLFLDQKRDTLLAGKELRVDITMLKLLDNTVDVQQVYLNGINAHIYRLAPDTTFNFDYIIKAFATAPKDTTKPTDTTAGMTFHLDKLMLRNVRFRMNDYTGGMQMDYAIRNLDLTMNELDPTTMTYHVNRLRGEGIRAHIIQDTSLLPPSPDTSTTPLNMDLAANELSLRDVVYIQEQRESQFLMSFQVGRLLTHPQKIDINNQSIDIRDFLLENAVADIRIGAPAADIAARTADSAIETNPAPAAKWRVNAQKVNLNQIDFAFNNDALPRQAYGMDYGHLHLQGFQLAAADIHYTTDTIAGAIRNMQALEHSGLVLNQLKTRFIYHPQGATLEDLYLQTDKTILQRSLSIKYPSLEALNRNLNLMQVQLDVRNSIVGMKDVLIFAPQLRQQPFFQQNQNGQLRLTAIANGSMSDLQLSKLAVSGLGQTEVDVQGRLFQLADPNKLSYQLQIRKLQSSRNDLEPLLPPAALAQVRLPDRFWLTGSISGTTTAFQPNLMLVSTDGMASIRGRMDMTTGREQYDLVLQTRVLQLGRLLKQDTLLGAITADIKAAGQGFDPKTMRARASGTISSAFFQGYTYQNISFGGDIAAQKANFRLNAQDPNARLQLTGRADLGGKYPAISAQGMIDSIDLQALRFYGSEMRVHGQLLVDVPEMNPDYPRGTISIFNPLITTNGTRYSLDTFLITARPGSDSGNNIWVQAQVLEAHLWGKMPLTRIGDIVQYQINRHYKMADSLRLADTNLAKRFNLPEDYDLNVQAHVARHPLIQGFVPGLTRLDTIGLQASVTPENLQLHLQAPSIQYANYVISGLTVNVTGNQDSLAFQAGVQRFTQGTALDFYNTRISGGVHTDSLDARVSISDADSTQRFALAASLQQKRDTQIIRLGEGLVLNYKPWNVAQPNAIAFGPQGFYLQNVSISNGAERLEASSEQPRFGAPIQATISDFLLGNLTEIISQDTTLLANGVLQGTVSVLSLNPAPQLQSDLKITNLSVLGDTVGDLNLAVKTANEQALDANVQITGRGNDIRLTGLYFLKPNAAGNTFDLNLQLSPLNVANFEGATGNAIRNTSGNLVGNMQFRGSLKAPNLNGEIRTEQLRTTVSMLNAPFFLPSEAISFSGQNIRFNNFSIQDSAGNKAMLNGALLLRSMYDMSLNLGLRADRWQPINSTAAGNKDFFGKLFLSTDLDIRGPVAAPDISGSVNILEGTDMTVAIPQAEPGLEDREGVVAFVDMSLPGGPGMLRPKQGDSAQKSKSFVPLGSNVDVNLNLNDNASFTVLVDAATGDFLRIKGNTSLNASVQPDGTIGLTGTYEIVDGMYQLNYNFLRRDFRIQRGSNIIFSGEPTEAEVNLTAVYEANVAPYDLVARQVQDPAELNFYKQRIPFDVQLKITRQMLQPRISFDIVLPEERNYRVSSDVVDVVRARLTDIRTDESELNKQVFALIVLNRFIGEDPFQSGAGGSGVEGIARQSASRFVSEQLNRFAGGLVKGLDLTVDLATSEDYTTGERRNRTDLNLGASKRLFNDRLTVTVGNNFQLEGARNTNQNTSLIPGNLAADYDLSNDQRYRVRFFRRNQDQGAFDGYIVETGVSFILQVDYNRFRQVFMSRKKREELRKERRRRKEEREKQDSTRQAIIPDNRYLNLTRRR